jgi:ribosomal protein L11 methyltransferase
MPFLQITLTIGEADPEPFEDALLAAGASSITLEDAGDDPVLEPAPGATPLWPRVRVKALFDASAQVDDVLASVRAEVGALPETSVDLIADRIWEREWLKDFRAMRFGRRLWICPGGQRPKADQAGEAPCLIELDPGLAFGTGAHPTTGLCLAWLDGADLHGRRVIDYGCGSGVLAIAALKLGASSALGVDIDAQALLATHDNAQRNGVAERLVAQLASAQIESASADVLLANILAGPLEELAPHLASIVRPGGHIVLSGVLVAQAARVQSRYEDWFTFEASETREGWARLVGVRSPASSAC